MPNGQIFQINTERRQNRENPCFRTVFHAYDLTQNVASPHTRPMSNEEDFSFEDKKVKFDFRNLRESGVDVWTRILMRISPLRGVKRLSRKFGVDPDVADRAHELFKKSERIDIAPSKSGLRGFQLIIDGSTALYFYQDGDHFVYDGFEGGEYGKGDVTIFD